MGLVGLVGQVGPTPEREGFSRGLGRVGQVGHVGRACPPQLASDKTRLINHFIIAGPDHVAHVAAEWRALFGVTAVLLDIF